ncbi:styrene monooxygenase/indole monooxygenase family protein [Actinorugispora endophytica]|uniref:Flavin-dependent dehydrogenase n=1 Tax=Actinorugispora endophytica TaxID=1605990 RepID=A0A4R6V2Y1_9ACTN|nr:styrene monooxygenase/indole monooxygenase family protein [Actinorugispora endophytica]TDQ54400.1 flavin-dependent dehydrogenase [Actinorugispora endophytica]
MTRMLIVGSGQSGLMLAAGLLGRGVAVDVFTRDSTAELRARPPALTQLTFPAVLAAERDAHLDFWSASAPGFTSIRLTMGPDNAPPSSFTGRLPAPGYAVDHRLKTADWLEHFEDQGGSVHVKTVTLSDLEWFARRGMYDVVVLAGGSRSELGVLFENDASRSGGATARVVSQVYLDGVVPGGADMEVATTPHGEVVAVPVLTPDGPATSVQVFARPGGPLDPGLLDPAGPGPRRRADPTPQVGAFTAGALRRCAPALAERCAGAEAVDHSALVVRVDPAVRRPVAMVGGTPVLGIGDLVLTVDPASGQGAAASTLVAATVREWLLDRAAAGGLLSDAAFLTGAYEAYWRAHGRYTSDFSRMVTEFWAGTLPETVLATFAQASTDPAVADEWVSSFDHPAAFSDWFLTT